MPIMTRTVPIEARSRPALITGRLLNCQLGGDNDKDNRSTLQAQLLCDRFNISAQRADLLSALIWGDAA